MLKDFSFFPEQASTVAAGVDGLYLYLITVSAFFTLAIYACVIFFAVRYKRRTGDPIPKAIPGNLRLEIVWSVIPLLISMTFFVWGAHLYFEEARPPKQALEMFAVGKQWMWKFQHPEGRREINELHVPAHQPVRITMTSEDVIHSFFVPAFRVKMDVLPGRYSQVWFEATKPGEYHLFCAEYCGTNHSGMIGRVVVMEPAHYAAWLEGSGGSGAKSMVSKGEKLFNQFNCQSCHGGASLITDKLAQVTVPAATRAPALQGVYNKSVELDTGRKVKADEGYLRESILNPAAKIVKGYTPLMPSYAGQVNEEQVLQLVAYLKSLGDNGKVEG